MKRILFILSLIISITACQKKTDKKEELARLTKEHDRLTEQIAKLQEEIAKEDPEVSAKLKAKTVAIAAISLQPFNHYIEIQGKVDGDDNVSVSPKSMGVVTSIRVSEGSLVSRGQVLAELDAEVIRKNLNQLKDQLQFATTLYDKQKRLWDQKIGSEVQYLTAKNNKESLENQIKTLEEQWSMSRIVSPISGTVEEIPIKVGQSVAPGITAFRVINFSRAKVMAELAEAYAPKVQSGDQVIITFPDYQQDISAKLSFASKYINPVNRTFTVEALFTPGKLAMKANMIAVVKINDYASKEAVVIPINTVQKDMQGNYVMVAVSEKGNLVARKKPVTLGMVYNGKAEVKSGLSAGDQLITLGYQDLNEGQFLKTK